MFYTRTQLPLLHGHPRRAVEGRFATKVLVSAHFYKMLAFSQRAEPLFRQTQHFVKSGRFLCPIFRQFLPNFRRNRRSDGVCCKMPAFCSTPKTEVLQPQAPVRETLSETTVLGKTFPTSPPPSTKRFVLVPPTGRKATRSPCRSAAANPSRALRRSRPRPCSHDLSRRRLPSLDPALT